MSDTTLDRVLRYIDSYAHTKRKKYKDGFKFNNPDDSSSDSMSFCIFDINPDGESASYKYHASKGVTDGGTLYDLAKKWGIEIVGRNERAQVDNSKRKYSNLAEYAQLKGVSVEVFHKAQWADDSYHGKPAIVYHTATGKRWRLLTESSNVYRSEQGYKRCWYGLDKAIRISNDENYDYIVLCNGESSTIVGQYYGIPVFSFTGGEKPIPENLLLELNSKWSGRIVLALDCDDTGRESTENIQSQLSGNGVPVDMMLSDKGDLADFCKLNTTQSRDALMKLVTSQNKQAEISGHETIEHRSDQIAEQFELMMRGEIDVDTRGFLFPIPELREFGGLCEVCESGKVTLIGGGSGTGKTQFLETINDYLNRIMGLNGLWYGAEWSKQEMHIRRIHRYTHASSKSPNIHYNDVKKHLIYVNEAQADKPQGICTGKRLPDKLWQPFIDMNNFIKTFHGTTEYIQHAKLADVLNNMRVALERERRNNRDVSYIIFDYVQLLSASDPNGDMNRYEYAFEMVKEFAIETQTHVFMTSQVNKQNQSDIREGKSLGMEAGHFIRPDKANLFLTINRQYYEDNGVWVETPAFFLNVVKASMGGRPENFNDSQLRIPMIMDYHALRFLFEDWREKDIAPFYFLKNHARPRAIN